MLYILILTTVAGAMTHMIISQAFSAYDNTYDTIVLHDKDIQPQ